MQAINPMELFTYGLASTIKMVITPAEYIFQSGTIGDIVFMSWLFLS